MIKPTPLELQLIGKSIYEMAKKTFEECGAPEDCCIHQYTTDPKITSLIIEFGEKNRLIIDRGGWRISTKDCTKSFINKWLERKE